LHVDPLDPGHPRAFFDGALQKLERIPLAFGDQLNAAVFIVPYPPAKAQLVSPALDEVAKADALHVPANDRV